MTSSGAGTEGYGEDPGWRRSLVGLFLLMPGISLVLAQRRAGQVDGLILLRTVYLSFVSALVAIVLVIAVILGIPAGPETSQDAGMASILVVVVGLVSLLGARHLSNRTLECSSEQALAESYRKSFFLGVALAELAALVAFVAWFRGRRWLAFPPGSSVFELPPIVFLATSSEDTTAIAAASASEPPSPRCSPCPPGGDLPRREWRHRRDER